MKQLKNFKTAVSFEEHYKFVLNFKYCEILFMSDTLNNTFISCRILLVVYYNDYKT